VTDKWKKRPNPGLILVGGGGDGINEEARVAAIDPALFNCKMIHNQQTDLTIILHT
jgi:hypothetical protein